MKTLEEVRDIFEKDRFATENGAVIDEIGELYAKCSVKIEPKHRNAMGGVMGGVPFMLADFAFAVASNHEVMSTVSVSSTITYLNTVKGDSLTAEARCVKDGRSSCCYEVTITDSLGRDIALAVFNGFKVSV